MNNFWGQTSSLDTLHLSKIATPIENSREPSYIRANPLSCDHFFAIVRSLTRHLRLFLSIIAIAFQQNHGHPSWSQAKYFYCNYFILESKWSRPFVCVSLDETGSKKDATNVINFYFRLWLEVGHFEYTHSHTQTDNGYMVNQFKKFTF